MGFGAMGLVVVREQILMKPLVGFYFDLWFVEMVEGFVSFFNRPKRSFYFTRRFGGKLPPETSRELVPVFAVMALNRNRRAASTSSP